MVNDYFDNFACPKRYPQFCLRENKSQIIYSKGCEIITVTKYFMKISVDSEFLFNSLK